MNRDFSWFYLLVILLIGVLYQNCGGARTELKQEAAQASWQQVSVAGHYTEQLDGCGPVVCSDADMSNGWSECFRLQDVATAPTEGQAIYIEGLAQKPEATTEDVDVCMSNMNTMKVDSWRPL